MCILQNPRSFPACEFKAHARAPMQMRPKKAARDLVILVETASDLCFKCGLRISSQATADIELRPDEMELQEGGRKGVIRGTQGCH